MNVESTIDNSIAFVEKQDIQIVTDFWGVKNIKDKWICNSKMLSPLGAVLVEHQLIFKENELDAGAFPGLYNLKDVRFNPTYSIMKLFHVDLSWVESFWHGLMATKIQYYKHPEVYNLGLKYHKLFQ